MAERRKHPHHRIRFKGDLSQNHSNACLPDDKDRSGRAFLVFGCDGKVINAQGRRSHAARVGHLRAIHGCPSRENSPGQVDPRPECDPPAPYNTLLTTFRTSDNSKTQKRNAVVPNTVPVLDDGDCKSTEADRERLVSAACNHQHSPTHLELDVFPLKIQGRAKAAYTYYTEIYIPTAMRKIQFRGVATAQDTSVSHDRLTFFLSTKVIFSAVLARAILQRDILSGSLGTASVDAIHAYGMALSFLHQHLLYATDKMSDTFIAALVFLIAFDNLVNNSGRVRIHATALSNAIACRGGLKKLGWRGQRAAATASLILQERSRQIPTTHDGKPVQRFQKLKPPNHPFSPKICAQVATLTPAFEELCLLEYLVEPVIYLIARISRRGDKLHPSRDIQSWVSPYHTPSALDMDCEIATTCVMLLQNPNLPIKDQLVVMALCAIVDYTGRNSFSHQAVIQSHARLIPSNLLAAIVKETRSDEWLTWVALIFLASSDVDTLLWSTAMHILEQQESRQSWEQRLVICGKYLWNTNFSLLLLQKLQHRGSSILPGTMLIGRAP